MTRRHPGGRLPDHAEDRVTLNELKLNRSAVGRNVDGLAGANDPVSSPVPILIERKLQRHGDPDDWEEKVYAPQRRLRAEGPSQPRRLSVERHPVATRWTGSGRARFSSPQMHFHTPSPVRPHSREEIQQLNGNSRKRPTIHVCDIIVADDMFAL
jgi:hypothetical protein